MRRHAKALKSLAQPERRSSSLVLPVTCEQHAGNSVQLICSLRDSLVLLRESVQLANLLSMILVPESVDDPANSVAELHALTMPGT